MVWTCGRIIRQLILYRFPATGKITIEDDSMKFNLPAREPFNFLSVVNSHGWRQLAPFSYDENTNTLSYILRLSNGRVIELKLRDAVDGISVETEQLDKAEKQEVKDIVSWMFGLDMDFSAF